MRSRCRQCSPTSANLNLMEFSSVGSMSNVRQRMRVQVGIAGMKGRALLSKKPSPVWAACILNFKSAVTLQKRGIRLSDGHPKDQMVYNLAMSLSSREMATELVVLPRAMSNTALLGIDFVEVMGVMVNASQ